MRKRLFAAMLSVMLVGAQSVFAAQPESTVVETGDETVVTAGITDGVEAQAVDEASVNLLEGISVENYPLVDGSTATLPLSAAVYQLATGSSQKETDQAIVHTKTTNSWLRLIEDEVDLLIVADKNEAVDAAIAEAGVELDIKPIALDAFIFMANEENPVQSLTQDEIVGIYSGQITNWSQVGGEDKEIVPFQRNENAGSQTAMKSLVMKGQEMIEPEMLEIGTMDGLLEAVASYNNDASALGYSYYYYANLMYKTPGLRFMAVDGMMPSNESVQKGEYPYIAQYFAAVRSDEPKDTPARRIFDWLTTTQGQELAADLGYIPLDETVQPEVIHTDEVAAEPIPIGENERLAVQTGESTLVILDQNGKVTERFENASLGNSSQDFSWLGVTAGAMILDMEEPIPIAIKTGEGEWDYKVGLYSLEKSEWLLKPEHYYMEMLSEDLCTDSSIMAGGGSLMRTDGTVLAKTEYFSFTRQGDYIADNKLVFDLDGNLLCEIDGYIMGIQGDRFIWQKQSNNVQSVYQDVNGNVLWTEASGLGFLDFCGEYLNWIDQNRSGLITDDALQVVMNDTLFWQANPEYAGTGNSMEVVAQSPDKTQIVVRITDTEWNNRYFVCDSTFKISEALPVSCVTIEWNEDRQDEIWVWQVENGQLHMERLWSDEVIDVPLASGDVSSISLYREGDFLQVQWRNSEWEYSNIYLADGMMLEGMELGTFNMSALEDDVISLYNSDQEQDTVERVFALEDGTVLCGGDGMDVLFANEDFRCVQYGSYIYVENYDGVMYVRLLALDEDIQELENYYYWEE